MHCTVELLLVARDFRYHHNLDRELMMAAHGTHPASQPASSNAVVSVVVKCLYELEARNVLLPMGEN